MLDDQAFDEALEEFWVPTVETEPMVFREARFNAASQPVVGVSWYEVRAYCNWLSAQDPLFSYRLPTEVEWEAAAAGPDGTSYPWGQNFVREWCNTKDIGMHTSTPIGVFVEGDSHCGASDMAGNVVEWTSSLFGKHHEDDFEAADFNYPYDATDGREDILAPPDLRRVLRGGGWNFDLDHARTQFRDHLRSSGRNYETGFRLSSNAQE